MFYLAPQYFTNSNKPVVQDINASTDNAILSPQR